MSTSETSPRSPSLRERLTKRFGRGGMAVLALVGLIGVFALQHAIQGKFPWDKNILKRTSQHLPLAVKDYRIIGLWYGSVISSVISAVLLIGARWWLPSRKIDKAHSSPVPAAPGRWAVVLLLVIISAAAWFRAPLLTNSLWNDEEYAMRRHAHGEWSEDKDGRREFHPVTWDDTIFDCRAGNNHHLNSIVTRLSLDAWRAITGAPREAFSEAALHTPSLISGLLTLALLGVLGCEMGLPWVGVSAAGLLAVHPWHVRYAVEARGYSLLIFFLCLTLVGLLRAFRTNRISAWMLFAVGEVGCFLSFAGALYPVAAVNTLAVVEFLRRGDARRIGTLTGFNLLAAIPVMLLLLPSVPQMVAYLNNADIEHYSMGWDWVRDLLCFLLTGAHYSLSEPGTHLGTSWVEQVATHALFLPVAGWMWPALIITGAVTALARNPASRLVVGSIVLGGVAAYVHNDAKQNPMVIWYLIFLLIPVVLAVPLAATSLVRWKGAQVPVILALVALFAFVTRDVRGRLMDHDRQPMRQTVEFIHNSQPMALSAIFGVSGYNTRSYDPFVRVLENESDLDAVIADAKTQNRPLFVYFCGMVASRMRKEDIMKRVLDPSSFEHIQDFPGLESMFSYHVYRAIIPATSE